MLPSFSLIESFFVHSKCFLEILSRKIILFPWFINTSWTFLFELIQWEYFLTSLLLFFNYRLRCGFDNTVSFNKWIASLFYGSFDLRISISLGKRINFDGSLFWFLLLQPLLLNRISFLFPNPQPLSSCSLIRLLQILFILSYRSFLLRCGFYFKLLT